ncbi:succinylglutamate-semialdehyde dehydrogenase [uncultured Caulobacter sp.]|uniref:succinylglutamate-semialdehyde dehydrogenase n=1 Tax=uncultured Caulobacter sp. TaxID=158749 RepID=UPI002625A74A|nr:succinylglutamate-semialdehyde dehydrogenase [uncultured Caulobacter sp.]
MSGVFIDGQWRAGRGPERVSTDPASGEVVWREATASEADVAEAVAAARRAFPAWADQPREARIAILRRYKEVLVERTAAFAEALSRETGKALWETKAELGSMAGKVDLSIKAYDERTGVTDNPMPFGRAVLRHRAHGVMAVLGPFNFPGHLPNGHIVPALLAGDTVVFKPSEETPLAGQLMVEALEAAGVPAGVVNLVQGGRETGQALINQEIDGLLFTGSAAAGAFFRRHFADRPDVILALELGGNNPLVVWDVGDAEAAAALVVQSAFITTGQRCSCARRLIVPDDASGRAVIEATAVLMDRLTIGPWNGEVEPFMGPLISVRAAQTARAVADTLGGERIRALGPVEGLGEAFVTPGMVDVTGVDTPDEELFAPWLQVRRVASFDEALTAANATRYGLSAGLISEDSTLWERFLNLIRAGVVNWNRPTTGAAGSMPFGGLGASGNHRPSAYYAADYCAYPIASFEAPAVVDTLKDIKGLRG